jgi:hypothetical protein
VIKWRRQYAEDGLAGLADTLRRPVSESDSDEIRELGSQLRWLEDRFELPELPVRCA